MPNILDIQNAIAAGKKAAAQYVAQNPEGSNWWPCGFAWVNYKCRKNAKEAGALMAEGFTWDDYRKVYSLSPYAWTNTQSMDYKAAILRDFVAAANTYMAADLFSVRTYID